MRHARHLAEGRDFGFLFGPVVPGNESQIVTMGKLRLRRLKMDSKGRVFAGRGNGKNMPGGHASARYDHVRLRPFQFPVRRKQSGLPTLQLFLHSNSVGFWIDMAGNTEALSQCSGLDLTYRPNAHF